MRSTSSSACATRCTSSPTSHQDQLTFELQEQLAADARLRPPGRSRPVEAFMRTYYRSATTANRFSRGHHRALRPPAEPYRGRLSAAHDPRRACASARRRSRSPARRSSSASPAALVERVPRRATARRARSPRYARARPRVPPSCSPAAHDDPRAVRPFLDHARPSTAVSETLVEMHQLGVLWPLFPEFAHLECLVSADPYHIYTVDEHSLLGGTRARAAARRRVHSSAPLLTEVMRELPQPEILLLGMLFHDIGKGRGDDHSARGAAMCTPSARVWPPTRTRRPPARVPGPPAPRRCRTWPSTATSTTIGWSIEFCRTSGASRT